MFNCQDDIRTMFGDSAANFDRSPISRCSLYEALEWLLVITALGVRQDLHSCMVELETVLSWEVKFKIPVWPTGKVCDALDEVDRIIHRANKKR